MIDSRDEAEMIVDLCEATHDKRLWWLAQDLRKQWGMGPQEDPPKVPDLRYLGIYYQQGGRMPDWISVKDRLPPQTRGERSEEVLVTTAGGMAVADYDHKLKMWSPEGAVYGHDREIVDEVTHWMRLPAAPSSTPQRQQGEKP